MPKSIDYEFPRGDTCKLRKFRIKSADGKIVNLTDAGQLYFTVKTDSNSNKVLLQKKLNEGIEIGDDGYYHITIEPSDTSRFDYGDYYYDIQLKTLSPKVFVRTLFLGTITLTDEITWEEDE